MKRCERNTALMENMRRNPKALKKQHKKRGRPRKDVPQGTRIASFCSKEVVGQVLEQLAKQKRALSRNLFKNFNKSLWGVADPYFRMDPLYTELDDFMARVNYEESRLPKVAMPAPVQVIYKQPESETLSSVIDKQIQALDTKEGISQLFEFISGL